MAYRIQINRRFEINVQQVYAYIATEFGNKAADNFLERLYIRIYSLSVTPFSGIVVPKQKDVRKIIISKHNKLYYRIKGKIVTMLILFSSKLNPSKTGMNEKRKPVVVSENVTGNNQ